MVTNELLDCLKPVLANATAININLTHYINLTCLFRYIGMIVLG